MHANAAMRQHEGPVRSHAEIQYSRICPSASEANHDYAPDSNVRHEMFTERKRRIGKGGRWGRVCVCGGATKREPNGEKTSRTRETDERKEREEKIENWNLPVWACALPIPCIIGDNLSSPSREPALTSVKSPSANFRKAFAGRASRHYALDR